MTTTLAGIRIEPNGDHHNVVAPADDRERNEWLRDELGALPEYGHYGTPQHAISIAVHETSISDNHPVNQLATDLVESLVTQPLSYRLHGVVILFGYERPGVTSSLRDDTRALLHSLAPH